MSVCHKVAFVSESAPQPGLNAMTDFNPASENLPEPTPSDQPWDRWRGRLKLLARFILALLTPLGLGSIPDDDYGAKDLDGGGFQTLFGSEKDGEKDKAKR